MGSAEGSWSGRVLEIALIVLSILLAFAINARWAGAQEQRGASAQLPTGALANLLASGELATVGDLELQRDLAAWPGIASLMSVKFAYLVVFDLFAVSSAVSAVADAQARVQAIRAGRESWR